MDFRLEKVAKRFDRKWILKEVDLHIPSGSRMAITGANGSGKSTLAMVIAGMIAPTKGDRLINGKPTGALTNNHLYVTMVAPYIDLYRDMNLTEAMSFHFKLKEGDEAAAQSMVEDLKLPKYRVLSGFSSGMLQRVKLLLAFASRSPMLILDEPSSNLDEAGICWMNDCIGRISKERSLIIASNEKEHELRWCQQGYHIQDSLVNKR